MPFQPQMLSAAECRIRNGALCFPIFRDLQAEILDTHWTSGKPAMDEHKCKYCCKIRCDHVKRLASWTYLATRAFQSCKISCHGFIQFVRLGGPTADGSNRRKWTAAKHATGTNFFQTRVETKQVYLHIYEKSQNRPCTVTSNLRFWTSIISEAISKLGSVYSSTTVIEKLVKYFKLHVWQFSNRVFEQNLTNFNRPFGAFMLLPMVLLKVWHGVDEGSKWLKRW